jgi:ubiquinone/menaquinone biosynthesis C-methylase UbiE
VPNKQKVIAEMQRVLKPGGHFSVSDIVLVGELPEALRHDAEMYAGCVAGAIQKDIYLNYIAEAGFENITVQKSKPIVIPDDLLEKYLSEDEIKAFKSGTTGIFSITVYGERPLSASSEESREAKKKVSLIDLQSAGSCCGPHCC